MNTAEFELMVREYGPMIRSLIYHITHDANDVDDIAQDVFLKAYQSLSGFRGGSFRAYLGRITRNHCYDVLRRRKARSGVAFIELVPDEWPSTEHSPEDTVVARETVAEVSAVLDTMNQVDKEILLLRHVHQFSYDEIAGVLNMKVGAVRTRISRARQRVVEEVEKSEERAAGLNEPRVERGG